MWQGYQRASHHGPPQGRHWREHSSSAYNSNNYQGNINHNNRYDHHYLEKHMSPPGVAYRPRRHVEDRFQPHNVYVRETPWKEFCDRRQKQDWREDQDMRDNRNRRNNGGLKERQNYNKFQDRGRNHQVIFQEERTFDEDIYDYLPSNATTVEPAVPASPGSPSSPSSPARSPRLRSREERMRLAEEIADAVAIRAGRGGPLRHPKFPLPPHPVPSATSPSPPLQQPLAGLQIPRVSINILRPSAGQRRRKCVSMILPSTDRHREEPAFLEIYRDPRAIVSSSTRNNSEHVHGSSLSLGSISGMASTNAEGNGGNNASGSCEDASRGIDPKVCNFSQHRRGLPRSAIPVGGHQGSRWASAEVIGKHDVVDDHRKRSKWSLLPRPVLKAW